jgi:hypothetical protein
VAACSRRQKGSAFVVLVFDVPLLQAATATFSEAAAPRRCAAGPALLSLLGALPPFPPAPSLPLPSSCAELVSVALPRAEPSPTVLGSAAVACSAFSPLAAPLSSLPLLVLGITTRHFCRWTLWPLGPLYGLSDM